MGTAPNEEIEMISFEISTVLKKNSAANHSKRLNTFLGEYFAMGAGPVGKGMTPKVHTEGNELLVGM